MCRFYLLLAGAVGKRQGISIPYPSPTPLLTPEVSAAAGKCRLPRAYRDIGSLYPVQVDTPQVRIWFGCFVFGLWSLAFQKITLGIGSFVFHWWWDRLFVPAATRGFDIVYCRITANRDIFSQFRWIQALFTNVAGCKNTEKMRSYNLHCKKTGIPSSLTL